jgi:hypothetical protein|uniref:Uncharacterized protein n=1 Tax=uncultured marine virus TaxID=186617 RepID=A0A0F7L244_9VIRU|nr:hypothetical protein [uncultured marine virus]
MNPCNPEPLQLPMKKDYNAKKIWHLLREEDAKDPDLLGNVIFLLMLAALTLASMVAFIIVEVSK